MGLRFVYSTYGIAYAMKSWLQLSALIQHSQIDEVFVVALSDNIGFRVNRLFKSQTNAYSHNVANIASKFVLGFRMSDIALHVPNLSTLTSKAELDAAFKKALHTYENTYSYTDQEESRLRKLGFSTQISDIITKRKLIPLSLETLNNCHLHHYDFANQYGPYIGSWIKDPFQVHHPRAINYIQQKSRIPLYAHTINAHFGSQSHAFTACADIQTSQDVLRFLKHNKLNKCVLKATNSLGGAGIYRVHLNENDKLTATRNGTSVAWASIIKKHRFLAMKLLAPEKGDVRVEVINGRICGVANRVPKQGSELCNISQGATPQPYTLSARDKKIALKTAEYFAGKGHHSVNIDLLSDKKGKRYVSEVNFTDTTCLHLAFTLEKSQTGRSQRLNEYAEAYVSLAKGQQPKTPPIRRQDHILVLWCGDLKSTYLMAKLLNETDHYIHAQYVHWKNPQHRSEAESQATQLLLHKLQSIRPFEFTRTYLDTSELNWCTNTSKIVTYFASLQSYDHANSHHKQPFTHWTKGMYDYDLPSVKEQWHVGLDRLFQSTHYHPSAAYAIPEFTSYYAPTPQQALKYIIELGLNDYWNCVAPKRSTQGELSECMECRPCRDLIDIINDAKGRKHPIDT